MTSVSNRLGCLRRRSGAAVALALLLAATPAKADEAPIVTTVAYTTTQIDVAFGDWDRSRTARAAPTRSASIAGRTCRR